MTNHSLRNSVGLASLSALALAMVACGGSSSSSSPATPTNQAPTAPVIVGPTTAITLHPAFYNLSATDPEGDAITFTVTGTDFTGAGNTATLNAQAATAHVLTVVAKDSKGASSAASTLTVQVAANRPPQFISQPTGQLVGSSSTINWTNFQVTAQDPDTDDVAYSIVGAPNFTNVTGGAVTINATTGAVSFTGTVPSGQTTGTASFKVRATDKLPGSGTVLGATADQDIVLTYFTGNTPPAITTTSIPSVPQNHGILAPGFQLQATDTQQASNTLTWSLVSGSTGVAVSATGLLTWTSAFATGSDFTPRTVTVKVTDNGGLSDTKTFNIPVIQDEKPNFATQTYTETVGGVQFFDPSRLRANITSRLRFNLLDVEATDSEFFSDAANNLKGWRANVIATDAENDAVQYSLKTNSVFRHGVPFTTVTAAAYPAVDANTGEIKWTPNRQRYNTGATGTDASLAATLGHDYVPNTSASGDSLQNRLDAANWSFTVVAQQLIGGVPTPNQTNETTLVIKVEPNDRPYQGPANVIWLDAVTVAGLMHGVYYNGGSAVAGVGRPSIQEPVASDTSTPGTPSKWIWVVGAPGGVNFANTAARNDYGLFDPNTNAIDGHMDAIKIDFGYRPETADHLVNGPLTGLVSGTHYPTLDTTGNYPAVDTANSLANGFYNPWISSSTASPGNMVVSWAPIRIQYTLSRYIGLGAYKFGLVSEDQYGRMNKGEKSVYPIFGTVFMFNSRYVWLGDTAGTTAASPIDAANRGNLWATGNTGSAVTAHSADQSYVFSYLPKGLSTASSYREWVDAATTVTYGANLFGRSDGAGAYASGYNSAANAPANPVAGNYYNASAGAWMTLDGVNEGIWGPFEEPYAANPLNVQLNPASRAAGVSGTDAGATLSYVQFKGGAPDGTGGNPSQINVTVSGPHADNTVLAKVVPSNSHYDFFLNNADFYQSIANAHSPYDDGYSTSRFMNLPSQGNDSSTALRHFAGQPQSEVNYMQELPGRAVWYSVANPTTANLLGNYTTPAGGVGVGSGMTLAPRLRISYTWPTIVTNTATGFPTAGTANLFSERDIMQVATPNLSGNARLFFTGNYPTGTNFAATPAPIALPVQEAGDATNVNWFGKFGIVNGITAAADVLPTGVQTTKFPHQPFHVVTDSLWIPNHADLKFNFPSAYTTPAGGSGYTDIPFIGIKGYLDRATNVAAGLGAQQLNGTDLNPQNFSRTSLWMQVGTNGGLTPSGMGEDSNTNPALLSTADGDRVFFLWLKSKADGSVQNAYSTWAGSQLTTGPLTAKGGITTAPAFAMAGGAGALTDTQAQISFAALGGQLGAVNQTLGSNTGISADGWKRTEFVLLANIMGAPAQFGLAGRVRVVQPWVIATDTSQITGTIWDGGLYLDDGIPANSLVVYGVRDRGTKTTQNGATYSNRLGEVGIEPGAPVIAQWWNTYTQNTTAPATDQVDVTDIALTNFPDVMKAYATEWLPADFDEVVAINHNFVGKIQAPGSGAADILQKVYLQAGVIAPKGHTLLSQAGGVKPVVTPVRQLAINDLKNNTADGSIEVGTKLDIFNGNAVNATTGAPATGAPDYKLFNGNGTADWTLNAYSNLQLTFQPAVNDLRHPSGYIVTIYRVNGGASAATTATPIAEYRMGHIGGIGAIQTLNLPTLASLRNQMTMPANGTTAFYAVKVRNVWMEGTEGAAGHSFDMGKEPWATRFPAAYADVLSGVFVARF